MNTENNHFLELEKNAMEIVDELNRLKNESSRYSDVSKTFEETIVLNRQLSEGLTKTSEEIASLSKSIRDEGFSKLSDSLEQTKSEIKTNNKFFKNLLIGGFSIVSVTQVIVIILSIL